LIVTEPDDPHADVVIHRLHEMGVPVFRFHPEEFPLAAAVSIQLTGDRWTAEIRNDRRSLRLEEARSAWLRRPGQPAISSDVPDELTAFALRQANATLQAAYGLIADRWLNSPDRMRIAERKPLQLLRAAQAGFSTPETLVSNSPGRAIDFRSRAERQGRQTAVKSLRIDTALSYGGKLWFPFTSVWPDGLADTESIALTPAVFQHYVAKATEIRAVVIGDRVFAASVDSQADPQTRHDVRAVENMDCYQPCELPEAVRDRLARLVRGFGLGSCSADLIHSPDDEYVFLELNPNGQWLWLETHAGLPLSETVAGFLAAGLPRVS
jgi:glutathione synthase/RimK-type ligase-like ATP-grasp enzyme